MAGSPVLNIATSADEVGSVWLSGAAPGDGGRRLKSGGMISGALVVTANSSGDCLVRPASSRKVWHPASAVTPRPSIARRTRIREDIKLTPITGILIPQASAGLSTS